MVKKKVLVRPPPDPAAQRCGLCGSAEVEIYPGAPLPEQDSTCQTCGAWWTPKAGWLAPDDPEIMVFGFTKAQWAYYLEGFPGLSDEGLRKHYLYVRFWASVMKGDRHGEIYALCRDTSEAELERRGVNVD